MGLTINTNEPASNAYRNLTVTQVDLSRSLERLSSGLRINRAADDAAGLAISEGLRAQINGAKQAVSNAQNGISVMQTAEGALTETHSVLQRMRQLSVQAANDGGLSRAAKGNIQDEIKVLISELSRIADSTQFNGKNLLDGSYTGMFQIGPDTDAHNRIDVGIATSAGKGLDAEGLGVADIDVSKGWNAEILSVGLGQGGIRVNLDDLNGSIIAVSSDGSKTIADLSGVTWPEGASEVEIRMAIAAPLNERFGPGVATVMSAAGTSLIIVLSTAAHADFVGFEISASGMGAVSGALEAIALIDNAILEVSSVRSKLGAIQNRFDHTINNLNVSVENLSASESRIRDADMAQEMVAFTRSQILAQSGTAMLAQAKNLPQSVLQLLQ